MVHLDVAESPTDRVRRIAVPGGWLYQIGSYQAGWSVPTFVPDCQAEPTRAKEAS